MRSSVIGGLRGHTDGGGSNAAAVHEAGEGADAGAVRLFGFVGGLLAGRCAALNERDMQPNIGFAADVIGFEILVDGHDFAGAFGLPGAGILARDAGFAAFRLAALGPAARAAGRFAAVAAIPGRVLRLLNPAASLLAFGFVLRVFGHAPQPLNRGRGRHASPGTGRAGATVRVGVGVALDGWRERLVGVDALGFTVGAGAAGRVRRFDRRWGEQTLQGCITDHLLHPAQLAR